MASTRTATVLIMMQGFTSPVLALEMAQPATEPLVITASRYAQSRRTIPAHVTVISGAEVKAAPGRAVDDVLRFVAGVTLPAGSSNIINPAPQSLSMMGVGGNGRVLVLMDGLPLTDGFGGWVNWSKVPTSIVDRIEILRGGSSNLYGTFAMSGVVNVITRQPKERALDLDYSYGERDQPGKRGTQRFNAYISDTFLNKFGLSADYNYYQTDGYNWLHPNVRGNVDHAATARNWALNLKAASLEGGDAGPFWFTRAIMFQDARNHGLDHFFDSRESMEAAAGFRRPTDMLGEFRGSVFVGKHILDSTNSAANAKRTAEFISTRNYLPSLDSGASLMWSRPFATITSSVTLGIDVKHVSARNNEDDYNSTNGAYTRSISSGGQQTTIGFFSQVSVSPVPDLIVVPSARLDYWQNHDAFETHSSGSTDSIPAKKFAFLSPRLAARYQVVESFAVRAAVFRAFTAPTLQNLYRGNRAQGNVSLPNSELGPEVLRVGWEAGWDLTYGDFALRATGFWNELRDAISNVTLSPGVTQVKNVSSVRSRGVVVEAPWTINRRWSLRPAYTYTNATIRGNVFSPRTVGATLPGIPVHSANFSLGFTDPEIITARLTCRYLTRRWGNDTHTQPLDEHFIMDFAASRYFTKALEVYFDAENLTDRRYSAWQLGSLPVLGDPLYVALGMRLHYR